MQLIGAGLRDHADLSAGSLAIFGRISIADHIEFTDGVNAQQLPADASGSESNQVVETTAVERQVFDFSFPNQSRNRRRSGIDHRRFSDYSHLFLNCSDFELQV